MQNGQIIDCDGHLVEPHDLWERYIDSGLHAKAPRLVADRNGDTRIALEGRLYPQPEGNGKGFPGLPGKCAPLPETAGVIEHRRASSRSSILGPTYMRLRISVDRAVALSALVA